MSDSPTKKRKANDGRATVPASSNGGGGGFLSSWLGYFSSGRRDDNAQPTRGGENLTQMDRMEKMMIRMEEKCSRLETECSSLRTMLKTKMEQDDCKFDSLDRQFEYNNMIGKNQSWKYSTPVHSDEYWEDYGYNEDVALYLSECSDFLKDFTEIMRRGDFPDYSDGSQGINLDWGEGDPILEDDARDKMLPHWIEFTNAIKQFTPAFGVLPDGCETYFTLQYVQLAGGVGQLLKDALMNKPFQTLTFVNKTGVGDNDTMSVDSIIEIMSSNKHLRKLTIGNNRIQMAHMEKFCSVLHRGSIAELDLKNCFENGLSDEMMALLLANGGPKLQRLGLDSNRINSSTRILANFLATNPPLKRLDLRNNGLSGAGVDLLANALRSNRSLRILDLSGNTISNAGKESLRLVLHNDSSLNSIADSNHSCILVGAHFHSWNMTGFWKNGAWHEAHVSFNRARKIYKLLSMRNKSMSTSNVQYFDEIDVKILPFMLKAVQRYAIAIHPYDSVKALSIVYEVMRKWHKVFPLYADRGNNDSY